MNFNATYSEKFFCLFCPNDANLISLTTIKNHLKNHFVTEPANEQSLLREWMDRHLNYQMVLNSTISQTEKRLPGGSTTLYEGCPVCENIRLKFEIHTPSERIKFGRLSAGDVFVEQHLIHHMQYYPFNCQFCGDETDISHKVWMTRDDLKLHIRQAHMGQSAERFPMALEKPPK